MAETNHSMMSVPSQTVVRSQLNYDTATVYSDNFHLEVWTPPHLDTIRRSRPGRTITCSRIWLAMMLLSLVVCLTTEGVGAIPSVSVNGQKSGAIRVNVTQEMIVTVAEQGRRHLQLSEEERLQQRGSGGEKAKTNHNPATTVNHDAKTHGNRKPDLRQSDTPTSGKRPCQSTPSAILRQLLGAAYNPRYMSIDKPSWADGSDPNSAERAANIKNGQRDMEWPSEPQRKLEAFHVHDGYTRILYEEPMVVLQNYDFNGNGKDSNIRGNHRATMDEGGGEDITDDSTDEQTDPPPHHRRRKHRNRNGGGKRQRHNTTHHPTKIDTSHESQNRNKNSRKHLPGRRQPPHQKQKSETVDTEAYFKALTFEQVDQQPQRDDHVTSGSDKFIRMARNRRSLKAGLPWSCESRIEWIDLGPNHFPRFLRSVVCTNDRCWYGHLPCRPRAFTVKILRRRKDSCEPGKEEDVDYSSEQAPNEESGVVVDEVMVDINEQVPDEFREQWVFEERAVTFCCECSA